MNFDELTINSNNKDDNHPASTATAANPEIETCFSETLCHATTSSVNHSCSENQPVSNQDLQIIIGLIHLRHYQDFTGFQRGNYFFNIKRL